MIVVGELAELGAFADRLRAHVAGGDVEHDVAGQQAHDGPRRRRPAG